MGEPKDRIEIAREARTFVPPDGYPGIAEFHQIGGLHAPNKLELGFENPAPEKNSS